MGALGRSGKGSRRHSPHLSLLAPSLAHPSPGAGVEALSAPGGWHSAGRLAQPRGGSEEALFPLPGPVGQGEQVWGGQVSPESQYLELSWAHACPPFQLLAMDPGQLILPPTTPSLSKRQHPCGCWCSLGKDVYGSLTQVLSQQAQSCFGQDWLCLGGLPVRERALGPLSHPAPPPPSLDRRRPRLPSSCRSWIRGRDWFMFIL